MTFFTTDRCVKSFQRYLIGAIVMHIADQKNFFGRLACACLLPSRQIDPMKKSVLPLFVVALSLTACGEKDAICSCIEAGDKLNKLSGEVLQGKKSEIDQKAWKQLKADKEKKCREFETMGGPEMLERKKDCE